MLKRRGLTVIELFVVLAIVAVLLSLLLPAVQSARERARETVCKNNVHQINLAIAQFAEAHESLPAPAPPARIGGWMVGILPFLEQNNLKEAIPVDLPIADAPETLFRPPPVFCCPRRTTIDDGSLDSMWPGHYVFVAASSRESYLIFDAPVHVRVPWLNGPEMSHNAVVGSNGPHVGGFFFARGFQQGVSYMLNGREIR